MIRALQPGSQPIDIPEAIPNPAVIPAEPEPAPVRPAHREPGKTPEKVPANRQLADSKILQSMAQGDPR
jgi:hypothetical protein